MSWPVGQVSGFAGVTIKTLHKLVDVAERAIEVQRTGVELSPEERFEIFGDVVFDLSYAADAHLKWGERDGHREALARAATHSKEDWRLLMAEAAEWRGRLLAAFDGGLPADDEAVLDLAEQHRQHIARWFTPCPPEMHCRIADDYEADARAFSLVVPAAEQRPGLAGYLRTAIGRNAERQGADGPGRSADGPGKGANGPGESTNGLAETAGGPGKSTNGLAATAGGPGETR